jgi:hypothetical protein
LAQANFRSYQLTAYMPSHTGVRQRINDFTHSRGEVNNSLYQFIPCHVVASLLAILIPQIAFLSFQLRLPAPCRLALAHASANIPRSPTHLKWQTQ